MDGSVLDEKAMIQYLLGQLSEEDRVHVEEAFFENDGLFEQLSSIEDDLIDHYVRGNLSVDLQKAVQKKIRSDGRWKQRVLFAEALAQRFEQRRSTATLPAPRESFLSTLLRSFRSQTPAFRLALGTSTFVVLLGVAWLASQMLREQGNVRVLQAERQNLQKTVDDLKGQVAGLEQRGQTLNSELEQERLKRQELENNKPNSNGGLGLVASFILKATLVRGADDTVRIAVPSGARTVRLQLELDPADEYSTYRAELRTAAGSLVASADTLRVQSSRGSKSVALDVPASSLSAGNYELGLLGRTEQRALEQLAYYYFTVK